MKTSRVLSLLVLVLGAAPGVLAHSGLEASAPRSQERLPTAPTEVWAEFGEPIDTRATHLRVYDANDTRVDDGATTLDGRARARVALRPGLPEGPYLVQWETVSLVDGHPSRGAWGFAVGNATPPQTEPDRAPGLPFLAAVGKTLTYAGLALACGVAATRVWLRTAPVGLATTLQLGAVLHLGGVLVFWLNQAQDASTGAFDYLAATDYGRGLRLRILIGLLLVGLAFLPSRIDRNLRGPALTALCLPLIALTASYGHAAASTEPRLLGIILDALHIGAGLTWAGGLVGFYLTLRDGPADGEAFAELARRAWRFSGLATVCLIVVASTGLLLTASIFGPSIRDWPDHLATPYGIVLLFKVLAAALMILLGVVTHVAYVRRFREGKAGDRQGLFRLNVRREVVNAAAIFLLAGVLTNLSPALPEPDPTQPALVLHGLTPNHNVTMTIDPPPSRLAGSVLTLHIASATDGAEVADATDVRVTFQPADPDVAPTDAAFRNVGNGDYQRSGGYFQLPGRWNLTASWSTPRIPQDEVTFVLLVS